MKKIRPLNNYVLLKELEEKQDGVILMTKSLDDQQTALVVSVGPGRVLDNGEQEVIAVKEGDEVLFKKFAVDVANIGDEEYLLIRSEDIIAVIE